MPTAISSSRPSAPAPASSTTTRRRPVEDLTSVDFAPDQTYQSTPIQAVPGFGYVFQMSAADGIPRYGALRVTHVGQTFLILDWAFQTDPGNPELMVSGKTK